MIKSFVTNKEFPGGKEKIVVEEKQLVRSGFPIVGEHGESPS